MGCSGAELQMVAALWGVGGRERQASSGTAPGWGAYIFLAVPQVMWDLSSLTRDQTLTLCIGSVES